MFWSKFKENIMNPIRLSVFAFTVLALSTMPAESLSGDKFQQARENSMIGLDELDNKLTFLFYDAVTGKPIEGAKFSLQGSSGVTDSTGKVTVKFPMADKTDVIVNGSFEKSGYIPSKIPVHLLVGTVFINRYSISPTLPPGKIRIVLDWEKDPPDLDAHLIKAGQYHISFRDSHNYEELASLDHDATDGRGPETITINKVDPAGVYTFLVHDYTHKDTKGFSQFKQSGAHVMVFGENSLMKSYEVPAGKGLVWAVFDIKNGRLVDRMEIIDKMPE